MSQTQVDKQRQAVLQAKFDANEKNSSNSALTDSESNELAELKRNA